LLAVAINVGGIVKSEHAGGLVVDDSSILFDCKPALALASALRLGSLASGTVKIFNPLFRE